MKAVNLIPPEQRRGGAAPGRSGGAVYIVLGALGLVVVALAAYVMAGNSVKDRQAELVRVTEETTKAEAQVAALKPYRDFAQIRQTRAQTVTSLAASRFDWERTMRQLGSVLPRNVWLSSMIGTVAPGVAFASGGSGGGGGSTGTLRGAVQAPAIELIGCTEKQADVSRVMARLRQMDEVTRVSLAASEKSDTASAGGSDASAGGASAGGGGGGSGGNTDCRNGSTRFPQFQIVVFFRPLPGATTGAPGAPGATPAAAAPQPAPTQPGAQGSTPAQSNGPGAASASQATNATGGAR